MERRGEEGSIFKEDEYLEDEEELEFAIRVLSNILCVLNVFLWLTGVIIMIVGVWSNVVQTPFQAYQESSALMAYTAILICSGTGLSLLGLMGCWGSLHLEHEMICCHSYMILLSAILEIAAGSIAISYANVSGEIIADRFLKHVTTEYTDSYQDKYSKSLYDLQKEFRCCGARSYRDWIGSRWWQRQRNKTTVLVVPDSCCKETRVDRFCNTGIPPYTDVINFLSLFQKGCVTAVAERKSYIFLLSGVFAIVIGIIKLISLVAINWLASKILQRQYEARVFDTESK